MASASPQDQTDGKGQVVIRHPFGHRINEMHVVKARAPQRPGETGQPGGRFHPGNLRTPRAMFGMHEQDMHGAACGDPGVMCRAVRGWGRGKCDY